MCKIFLNFLNAAVIMLIIAPLYAQQKKDKPEIQFLRFTESNDFIDVRGQGTDRLFTNGTKIDFFYTKPPKRNFLTKLLIPINSGADDLYGIGITQLTFTPNDISRRDIITDDRPYAGLLYLTHTLISSDHLRKEKLTTEINIGVIGPLSFAKEMQTWLHGLINYQKPMGWGNQVKNDFLLNYQIQYEKSLISPSDKFEAIGLIEADAGLLSNKITAGLTFRVGRYNPYFSNYEKPGMKLNTGDISKYKKSQFYFHVKPTFTVLMDNSTLQGGMFTGRQSVYTITADDIKRVYMQFEYGFLFSIKRFAFSVKETFISAEFKNAPTTQFGSFTFFIGL
jgi:lipid A 3-O-deacylase